nr:acyloxyacyl hydrolase-like [Ciona intestinalis]|eukprot:XP_002121122.3 acyloxyacyl hydrolase-like [Ciona intestinalis]
MHRLLLCSIVVVLVLLQHNVVLGDANGGSTCAACSLIVGLVEQLAQVHSTDVITAAEQYLCNNLPSPLDSTCTVLLDRFGPSLIDAAYHKQTPDIICHNIGLCTQEPGTNFCHLFPLPDGFNGNYKSRPYPPLLLTKEVRSIDDYPMCDLPGVKDICEHINRFADGHLPLQDSDLDKYSIDPTLRGSHWRGKDCDDTRSDVYPGRRPINMDITYDSNCNGIYGADPQTGRPYEELYCANTNPKGVVILGDSAAAHFHLPPEYFMAEVLNKDTFKDVLMLLTDEFDWPELSAITAFTSNEWPESIDGPVDSIYMKLYDRNRCIHRDFQNIGVNGARSGSMTDIVKSLARNATQDYPLFIVLALVGNDVCNGHPDTIDHMTTPEDYRSNMMTTLRYLDNNIPKGSNVMLVGLADGRVLWDTLHDRMHPIGQLNKDVSYKNLYDYLNCLEVSPCTGWMNSNETLRNLTSQRAHNLSIQAKNIVDTEHFQNFTMAYMDYDVRGFMDMWEDMGGQDWEVIEPVDGFHPSQTGQSLTAQYMYDLLTTNFPDAIGKVNENNDKIIAQFGGQGGY